MLNTLRRRPLVWLLGALFLYNLALVTAFSVNVPIWDEWDYPQVWETHLDWAWLWRPHNEHRIVATKLLSWLVARATHTNYQVLTFVSFFVYAAYVLLVLRFVGSLRPRPGDRLVLGFGAFLLTPLLWENHLSGFQSQFHFAMLFAVIAWHAVFLDRRPIRGAVSAVAGMYCFSSGVVFGLVLAAALAGRAVVRRSRRDAFGVICLVAGLFGWWYHHAAGGGTAPLTFPWKAAFWEFYGDIVALGFGIQGRSAVYRWVVAALVYPPIAWLALRRWRSKENLTDSDWALLVALSSIFAALAAIAVGRAATSMASAKTSRYAEIAILLTPLTAVAWHFVLFDRPGARRRVLALLAVVAFAGFVDKWYPAHYVSLHAERERGAACVRRFCRGESESECPELYPLPMGSALRRARELQPSFCR